MLAKCGVQVAMSDLFGVAGTELLDRLELPKPYAARIASLRRIIDLLDFEIDVFAQLTRAVGPRPRVRRGADHPRDRPDPGRGVRRRDR